MNMSVFVFICQNTFWWFHMQAKFFRICVKFGCWSYLICITVRTYMKPILSLPIKEGEKGWSFTEFCVYNTRLSSCLACMNKIIKMLVFDVVFLFKRSSFIMSSFIVLKLSFSALLFEDKCLHAQLLPIAQWYVII